MLRFLVSCILLLFTFLPSPAYADHCSPGSQFLTTHHIATYCVGNSIYVDVDNCDDPAAVHHRPFRNCQADEQCYKNPASVGDYSDTAENAKCVPNTAPTGTSANDAAGLKQIEDVFKNVISVVVGLAFIACLIVLIMAGIKYLTSGGEPKAIQSAHQTVTWALLGILFMAVGWIVLQLIKNFTGIDVTIFDIKKLCDGVVPC